MGRNNKKYTNDLKQQIYKRLNKMLSDGVGTSKKLAKVNGEIDDKIFSYNTYKTYWKHLKYFAVYVKENHPDATTLKAAKKYAVEWLEFRANQTNDNGENLSAWTIHTEAKAINKLFDIRPNDSYYFNPPKRNREDIKRSRGEVKRDKHFSEKNNDEFVRFCKATGCRRNILEKVVGQDFFIRPDTLNLEFENKGEADYKEINGFHIDSDKSHKALYYALNTFPDCKYFLYHRNDKGGKDRFAPIIGPDINKVVDRIMNTPKDEKVWKYVPRNADIHGYRRYYATQIYLKYARDIEDIPYDKINSGTGRKYQSEVYVCRKDEKGKKLDKAAMLKASIALGHNRIEIVANNYIRGL